MSALYTLSIVGQKFQLSGEKLVRRVNIYNYFCPWPYWGNPSWFTIVVIFMADPGEVEKMMTLSSFESGPY